MTDKINQYISLLQCWNKKINLVQSKTLNNVMERHIQDSAQIISLLPKDNIILDIGTGAGLPGVVLSIYGVNNIILCEKVFKKVVFLREVKRKLNLNYEIFAGNIYDFNSNIFNLPITAVSRAFGSLKLLFDIMNKLKIENGIFHKGETYKKEFQEIENNENFNCEVIPSLVNNNSVILKVQAKWQ